MLNALLAITLLALPFLIIGLVIYLVIRENRMKKAKFNALPDNKKLEIREKEQAKLKNTLTFVIPIAILLTLQKEIGFNKAIFISLGVAVVGGYIFRSSEKNDKWNKTKIKRHTHKGNYSYGCV